MTPKQKLFVEFANSHWMLPSHSAFVWVTSKIDENGTHYGQFRILREKELSDRDDYVVREDFHGKLSIVLLSDKN